MSLLLLVEGQSDRDVLPILVRKMLPSTRVRAIWEKRGNLMNPEKVKACIRAEKSKGTRFTKIFICVDSECTPVTVTQGTVTEREAQLAGLRPPPRYIVVDHSLEGWLLKDLGALQKVLGRKVVLPKGRASYHCRPHTCLAELFGRCHKDFLKTTHNPLIAQVADPERIAESSPTFAAFKRLVEDP